MHAPLTILLVLVAWCVVSVPVSFGLGRIIKVSERPRSDRSGLSGGAGAAPPAVTSPGEEA